MHAIGADDERRRARHLQPLSSADQYVCRARPFLVRITLGDRSEIEAFHQHRGAVQPPERIMNSPIDDLIIADGGRLTHATTEADFLHGNLISKDFRSEENTSDPQSLMRTSY